MAGDGGFRNAWEYIDFELEIGWGGSDGYPLTVRSATGSEARAKMLLPFDERALENKLQALEIALLRRGTKRRRIHTREEQTVRDFGRGLFESLLTGEARDCYEASREQAKRQDKGLRLKLRVQPPELARLPWEFLYDPDRAEYLSLSRATPLVRYPDLRNPVDLLPVTPPLRILGMVASPINLDPLDVEHERELVEKAVKDLQAQGRVEFKWVKGQNWRDLQRTLWRKGEWHIFHFIGHGEYDPGRDEGLVALANEAGYARYLSAEDLAQLLKGHNPLRLVVLNSCEGARGGGGDPFSSAAATLVRPGIPAALAMQYEITDEAAIEFSRTFYEAVASGLPVDAAVAEARTSVKIELGNTLEWGTPVLYMRSPDGRIFDISTEEERSFGGEAGTEAREDEERRRKLIELYEQARRLYEAREWQAVVGVFSQMHALDPGYADPEGLLVSAREAQRLTRRVAAAYDRGRRHMESGEWPQAVESFEEVRRLKPDDTKVEALLARARREVAAQRELERRKEEYRRWLRRCWRGERLSDEDARWLVRTKKVLKLDPEVADAIEREVMGDVMAAIVDRQEQEARNLYREVLRMGWKDGELEALRRVPPARLDALLNDRELFVKHDFADCPVTSAERRRLLGAMPWAVFAAAARLAVDDTSPPSDVADRLHTLAGELRLSADQAGEIEREVLDDRIENVLERQVEEDLGEREAAPGSARAFRARSDSLPDDSPAASVDGEPSAASSYRAMVEDVYGRTWAEPGEAKKQLGEYVSELGLDQDQAAEIEREIMGRPRDEAFRDTDPQNHSRPSSSKPDSLPEENDTSSERPLDLPD